MSEQRLDQLKDKCPECGSKYLVRDNETGELACSSCGAVLEEVEYVPDFVPRTVERGSFAYAGLPATGKPTRYELLKYRDHRYLYMIGRGESRERIVADIAAYVSILAGRLGVNSKVVEEEAMRLAKWLLKQMRERGKRLTAEEIAAVSLWQACKVQGFPITMKDYESVCAIAFHWGDGKSLLRLIGKAREIGFECNGSFELKDYVWRFAAKLRGCGFDEGYVDALAAYASHSCDAVKDSDELGGKNPACVAAAAMRVADELMGGWIGHERLKEVLNVGFSKDAYRLMRRKIPPLPNFLWEKTLTSLKKRVMDVRKSEVVGNATR